MSSLYYTIVYNPLYNGLVFLIDAIPWADAGIIVILFTIIVKLVLFPLSRKAVVTQLAMKKYDGELKEIREKHKDDKQKQALETMAFYKEKGIRPFLSFLLIFIQIPIIIALYSIFYKGGLPIINTAVLYDFIQAPANAINMVFLGLVDVSVKSLPLALLAGITTFFQIRFSMPKPKPREAGAKPSFQDDLAHSMHIQMKYIFPVMAVFISYHISAAIALYWITSNLFTIGQELIIRKKFNNGGSKENQTKTA